MGDRIRRIPAEQKARIFTPPEPTVEEGVEIRFVSDERAQHEQDILDTREAIDTLVEDAEDVLRRLNEISYRPENKQAILAYATLLRSVAHFKVLQTEIQHFRG